MELDTSRINVWDKHPKLYHYTDLSGLKGIVENNTIWANHYRSLNDFTEVVHAKEYIRKSLHPILNRIIRDKCRKSLKFKTHTRELGGIDAVCLKETDFILSYLYETTFERRDQGYEFAQPFIVSFCSHEKHSRYVQENGLLSMWRAYGSRGGFALEFDTKKLWELFDYEREHYSYIQFIFGDVFYDENDQEMKEEFQPLYDILEKIINKRLANDVSDSDLGEIFAPFFSSVTRFKHQGFSEEHEVRLIVSPITRTLLDELLKHTEETYDSEPKKIHHRVRLDELVPYIELNDKEQKSPLPIRRIIIEPQENQDKIEKNLLSLLGDRKVNLHKSRTPYLPPRR